MDLCLLPLQQPPAGQVSNFTNPSNLVVPTIAISTIFTGLCLAFLAGRFAQNWMKMRTPDYLAIVGFVLSTSYTGVVIAMRNFARHSWDVPMCWYLSDYSWQLLFASNMLLGPTQFVVKVAILLLYFQIFAVTTRTKVSIILACVFSGLIYLVHPIMVVVFEAPRIGQTWSEPALSGMAAKLTYYAPIHGIGSVILDIWILLIPIPAIIKLQVSAKKKVQLLVVFVTGFLLLLDKPGDSSWYQGQLFIWIIIEHNVAVMVGSMPAFAGMIKAHVSGSFASLRSRMYGRSSGVGHSGKGSLPASSKSPSSFGSGTPYGAPKSHAYYYELSESITHPSPIYVGSTSCNELLPRDEEQGIFRSTNFEQQSLHKSSDRCSIEGRSRGSRGQV
ncbi:hypothetical protein JX265_004706 [Neoarthrinium moseri]|uniref:Rhodopsin domain-containing protein n=1 Tax=Neoarthrinium moseri TaxID=1658444 RepID=A0A9P9WQ35_9PEZI|nr:hypothetical protein JX265_004706 [Neoarthrinium moseri]